MIYQIYSNGTFLDTPDEFFVPITKEIADVREPENRASDWSKTFKLPATKINREYFSHLYHINYDNESTAQFTNDFNPNYRAACEVWVDSVPQLTGFLRLIQINVIDDNDIEFECSIHGAGVTLFNQIAGRKMSDLDFSEYAHTFDITNVTDSWDNNIVVNSLSVASSNGTGYLYSIINDGTLTNYNTITLNQCKPFLFAKTVIDKILSGTGFSYSTGSFFNTTLFKKLIVSSNDGFPISAPIVFDAETSGSTSLTVGSPVNYATETDPYNIFNLATDAMATSTVAIGKTNIYLNGEVNFTGLTPATEYAVGFQLQRNGTPFGDIKYSVFVTNGSGNYTGEAWFPFNDIYIGVNQIIEVIYKGVFDAFTSTSASPATETVSSGFRIFNRHTVTSAPNSEISFADYFSTELSQADFLKGFIKLFNLYVDIDPDNPNELIFLPYEEYYVGTARDWTNKLDKQQPTEIIPMGELNARRYEFTYQKAEDTYNKNYFDTYNRIFGDAIVEVDNDFVNNTKKIEIPFQPSQVGTIGDKTFPLIDKFGGIRLLLWGGKVGCSAYRLYEDDISFGGLPTYSTLTTYPLTLNIDDPHIPATDILFGIPFDGGYAGDITYTDNNCYNAYWSRYINEITDVNSKIVTAYFNITPADFQKLSFRDTYFFENSYFRLNKVIDYVPDRLTKCEFIQLQSYPSFVASSGEVGFNPEIGGRVLRIGEAQFTDGFKSILVGQNIGQGDSNYGNIGAASSGVTITGNNNAVFASSGITVSDSNSFYWFNKKVDLYDPTEGDVVKYTAGEWAVGTAGGGAATFTELTDTPETFSGQTGKFVKVNAGETALEFAALAGGGDMLAANNLSDVANVATARTNLGVETTAAILLQVYPVGAIYTSVVSTSPATLFGGTWSAFGAGRVLVGIDAGQTEFDTVEETGGAKTHTLTESEMPSHTHIQDAHTHTQDAHSHIENAPTSASGGALRFAVDTNANGTIDSGLSTAETTATNQNTTATNQNTGGGAAHNNLQPYIVVYFWKRTA